MSHIIVIGRGPMVHRAYSLLYQRLGPGMSIEPRGREKPSPDQWEWQWIPSAVDTDHYRLDIGRGLNNEELRILEEDFLASPYSWVAFCHARSAIAVMFRHPRDAMTFKLTYDG